MLMWSHSKLNKPDSIILHAFHRISILITESFLYFHEWMIVDALDFIMDDGGDSMKISLLGPTLNIF